MNEYIIVGDTEKYKDCLIYVCGTKENAEKTLEQIVSNPSDIDLKLMKGHTNLRIKEVPIEKCWWLDR